MRLCPCVPAVALLLPLTACDGPSLLQLGTNPASLLEVALLADVDTLLPGDELAVTIVVRNPTSVPIAYAPLGEWPFHGMGFEVIAPDGQSEGSRPRGIPTLDGGRPLFFFDAPDDTVLVAPGDSVVLRTFWDGLEGDGWYDAPPFPSGPYRLRPALTTESGTYRGSPVSVRVLPWTLARFVHTGPGLPTLAFDVESRNVAWRVAPALYTTPLVVGIGRQRVAAHAVGDDRVLASGAIEFREGVLHTVALRSGPTGLEPWDLTDPAVGVGSTESRLRVVHLAVDAPTLEVYVTPPASPDPVAVAAPFPYGSATPYRSGFGGGWRVTVTTSGQVEPLLTAPMQVYGGQVRTLVLLDDGRGGVRGIVLDP